MRPERRAQEELDAGVAGLELVPGGREVAAEVDARGEEIGDHQHARGPPGDATLAAGRDIGLGQLEEAGHDDRVLDRAARRAASSCRSALADGSRLPWAISRTAVRSDGFDGAVGSPGGSIGASFRVVRARSDSMVRGGRGASIFGMAILPIRDETIDPAGDLGIIRRGGHPCRSSLDPASPRPC